MKIMRTPRTLDLMITSKCNLRCAYCSHFSSAGDMDEDLSADDWLHCFEELGRLKVMEVCLQGGEPFLRQDLEELIGGIVDNGLRFSILSNGTLITDDMAVYLASTGRCNGVQISIDGPDAATHDTLRGDGTFMQAVQGLKTLRRFGVNCNVRVTIHRRNVNALPDICRFLLKDLGLDSFSTNSAAYFGLCRKNQGVVQLTVEERSLAMQNLVDLFRLYNGRIHASAGPLAEALEWESMERSRREKRCTTEGKGFLTSCQGPLTNMAVRADGAILVCAHMPGLVIGHVNEDDLAVVWQQSPVIAEFRQRMMIPLTEFSFCDGCPYVRYCTGGCPALAYSWFGNPHHPSPESCYRLFLQGGGTLPSFCLD